jgi:WD40 repeat protein
MKRGVDLCQSGKPATGLSWLAQTLDRAPVDDPLRPSICRLLGGWSKSVGLALVHQNPSSAHDVICSPNGEFACTQIGNVLQLSDLETGEPTISLNFDHDPPRDFDSPVFSLDGNAILVSCKRHVWLCNPVTGQRQQSPIHSLPENVNVVFSPDGRKVITFSGQRAGRYYGKTAQLSPVSK